MITKFVGKGTSNMKGRHEHKFYINTADCIQLRSKLNIVANLDKNVGEDGTYRIRSLYFDNYADKMVTEKLKGLSRREKFRIRYYNNNTDFIRLEKKYKINTLTYKKQALFTKHQCQQILEGRYECLKEDNHPQLFELYSKMHFHALRPHKVVDYTREVYIYKAGNVRVTFDSDIRMSSSVNNFLSPNLATIPATNAIILEIKYDGFLPDVLRKIVNIDQRSQTEFSKYVVSKLV